MGLDNAKFDFGAANSGSKEAGEIVDNPPSTGVQTQVDKAEPAKPKTAYEEKQEDLDIQYIEKRSITINLVQNHSLYRRANDKNLPRKHEYIGSSIRSSSTLAANKDEVAAYFPNIIGIATNDPSFVTRVKQYLNNFQIEVTELGKTIDCSFRWNHKRDYLQYHAREQQIEERYKQVNRGNLQELKEALEAKITDLNLLESTRYAYGNPVNVEDYIKYRHCLLYRDIAKDTALINSDITYRFYFKDDVKEAELLQKRRLELNNAKRNYLAACGDDELFDAVYIQYCVADGMPVLTSILKERIEKEIELDRYSMEQPVKFNKMFNDRDLKIKAFIETLIARGEFMRASDNQNISTVTGEFIGANMKEAVIWYKNPANEKTVLAYKNKLKYS